MDSATSLEALPSLSKETRRENSRSTGLPPPVSLVLPGISGFCGSELYAVMMLEPAVSPEAALLLEPPQRSAAWPRSKPWQRKQELSSSYDFSYSLGCEAFQPRLMRTGSDFLIVGTLTLPAASDTQPRCCYLSFLRTWETSSVFFCYTHVKFRGSCRLGSVFAEFVNQCPHSGHARGKACP